MTHWKLPDHDLSLPLLMHKRKAKKSKGQLFTPLWQNLTITTSFPCWFANHAPGRLFDEGVWWTPSGTWVTFDVTQLGPHQHPFFVCFLLSWLFSFHALCLPSFSSALFAELSGILSGIAWTKERQNTLDLCVQWPFLATVVSSLEVGSQDPQALWNK